MIPDDERATIRYSTVPQTIASRSSQLVLKIQSVKQATMAVTSRCAAVVLLSLFAVLVRIEGWVTSVFRDTSRESSTVPVWLTPGRLAEPSNTSGVVTSDLALMKDLEGRRLFKLQGKILKELRKTCLDYNMLEEGDHIMVCVSGGKDSCTLLYLLLILQRTLPVRFNMTAVHVDQNQPGYDGTRLINWLQELGVPYHVVAEDTYSIVVEKNQENKSYCTLCSRLRRGILYTTAQRIGCNKIALGHHGDDAMETLLLNLLHAGQLKSMPARYTSTRYRLAVLRPLIYSLEHDIREYALLQKFPILPCNLCSNQANLQRPQIKLMLNSLEAMNPNVRRNLLNAMSTVRPSHLLDQELRIKCGLDPITGQDLIGKGEIVDDEEYL
jgi:tRNA 2-thiocytidine biosynthesis protein TtcA